MMGRYIDLNKNRFKNVTFSLEEKQVKTLWKIVEDNGFKSLSEVMRDVVRGYIVRMINFGKVMEDYTADFRRVEPIDHVKFRKFCNDELKSEVIEK